MSVTTQLSWVSRPFSLRLAWPLAEDMNVLLFQVANGSCGFRVSLSRSRQSKAAAKCKPLVLLRAERALADFSRGPVKKDRGTRVTARRCVPLHEDADREASYSLVDDAGTVARDPM